MRVFYIKNICIKFFEVGVRQLIDVDGEPVAKDNLELLSANVNTAIEDLALVPTDLNRLRAILVSVLSEYFWNIITILFLISIGVLVWIMI